ncbi:putative 34 kDa antigenic protein [Mycobacterium xenopi 4042]|uniref:Putative 34 kDa antigenic protein n=1 Tax=Mycobacterium xenopi 4042 TaxID=1299334 RepID=X8AFW3_MYCXE|nr:putative 34 kDa antigenic protein [Mycobacterium xenopi 4042]
MALGLAAYLASFGPMFTISADLGPSGSDLSGGGGGLAIVAALLAALLAAVGLLPKAKNYTAVVGAVAVVGALLAISQALSRPAASRSAGRCGLCWLARWRRRSSRLEHFCWTPASSPRPRRGPDTTSTRSMGSTAPSPADITARPAGSNTPRFSIMGSSRPRSLPAMGRSTAVIPARPLADSARSVTSRARRRARSSSLRSKVRPLRRPDSPAMASRRLGLARVLKVTAKATPETRGNRPGPAAEPGQQQGQGQQPQSPSSPSGPPPS